jgi:tRNA pseudouridine38-40 synthase
VRLRLLIEYDGTCFSGWQNQRDRRTVQGVIEEALGKTLGRRVGVTGSGRTDAGVHAAAQVAHLDVADTEFERARSCLSRLLPPDLAVLSIEPAPPEFSARFSAVGRVYEYRILREKHPLESRYAWTCCWRSLDTVRMSRAAALSVGRAVWRGFSREGSSNRTWIADVRAASVEESHAGWTFRIEADRFLRGMVRLWAGTLVEVGRGRLEPEVVTQILETGDRRLAGPSLPPCGLTLTRVEY